MKQTSVQTQTSQNLKSLVEQYRLELDGVRFWTPYPYENLTLAQRREHADQEPTPPPLKGRGMPCEIRDFLKNSLKETDKKLSSAQEYREYMASLGLGVDCSGFSYYVLDQFLQANYGQVLADHLHKSREELLAIYDDPALTPPPDLERVTVQAYPDWVSLSQIQADWGNKPRFVVSSEVFVNQGSTIAISIEQLQAGDLIGMMGHDGIGHHLVVVKAKEDEIIYAHSAGRHGDKNGLGGVEYGQVKITDPDKSIEKQAWSDQLILQEHEFNAQPLRRLKVLAIG